MKIVWLVDNLDSIKDPIGRFARMVTNEVHSLDSNIEIITIDAATDNLNKLQKCFSLRMTKALMQAAKLVWSAQIRTMVVEYPFMEWNPCILVAYGLLRLITKRKKCALVLSIHEYLRARYLRKAVIRALARMSDALFVSDKETKEILSAQCGRGYVRRIFSPITPTWKSDETKKINRNFIYFGLVNPSKAFQKMLDAFSLFNQDKSKHLSVYTSSDLQGISIPEDVELHLGCADAVIVEALKNTTYSILPILPEVGPYSSSFIGSTQAGCTCIGHFEPSYLSNDFVIDVPDYSKESFAEGLKRAYELPDDRLMENVEQARAYGKQFGAEETAKTILHALERIVEELYPA